MGDYSIEDNPKLTSEQILLSINEALYHKKHDIFKRVTDPQTSVHILGAPRSGTTLLSQLIISHLDLGYINNLVASFWKAPVYGIHLSKRLLGEGYISNYNSSFGRTHNIREPHEFSYFWKGHLNYDDFLQRTYIPKHSINWDDLKTEIYQMVDAYQKPIVFKSFLLGFHSADSVKHMPNTVFLLIKRNIYQNAYSILKLREQRFGDIEFWASMRPHQYHALKDETVFRQIIGQVYFLNYEYKKQLEAVPSTNKLHMDYEELCKNAQGILESVQATVSNFTDVSFTNGEPEKFEYREEKIPENILIEFKKAEDWLLKSFSELRFTEC